MWEGVLHMTPAPTREHQRILDEMIAFLMPRLRDARRGTLQSGINVFRESGGAVDYRIPDLTFVAAGREHVLHADGVRGEGPDAVIEIRSPEDETYDKLPFFASVRVQEVIVCDRDSKRIEVMRLAGSQFVALQPDADGWLTSTVLGFRFRRLEAMPPRLRIEDARDPAASVEV